MCITTEFKETKQLIKGMFTNARKFRFTASRQVEAEVRAERQCTGGQCGRARGRGRKNRAQNKDRNAWLANWPPVPMPVDYAGKTM